MPTSEEISHQQNLLQTYRRTLAHYLKQLSIVGEANLPPATAYGIDETRQNIARIKGVLRKWDVTVVDHPDDGSASAPPAQGHPVQANVDTRRLRKVMSQAFDLEDLQLLCADIERDLADKGITLPINMEIVGGSGKDSKILNLITYLERRGYLADLVAAVRRERPDSM